MYVLNTEIAFIVVFFNFLLLLAVLFFCEIEVKWRYVVLSWIKLFVCIFVQVIEKNRGWLDISVCCSLFIISQLAFIDSALLTELIIKIDDNECMYFLFNRC